VVLALAGLFSLIVIPKESAPEVEVPIGIVSTALSGANARDIENLVTNKIEDNLNSLSNVKSITSTSQEGLSIVVVEFSARADIDKSIQDLKDEVDRVKGELPRDAFDPLVSKLDFVNQPVLIASLASDLPPTELIDLAEETRHQIELVPGVSRVVISGLRDREVQVIVEQDKLDLFGIRLVDVVSAIGQSNTSLPIGNIVQGGIEYNLKFEGSIRSTEDVANIAITNKGGEPVYVRDVAFVSDGVEKTRTFSRVSIDRSPSEQAISLSVFKRAGGDITDVTKRVRERLLMLTENGDLGSAQILISFDVGEFVRDDLKSLSFTALQTVLLVMLILFLTIGWRESLLAGLAIPLSFLLAFIGLYLSGNTVNFVSLFALILAVGILVDSAIVITEAVHSNLKNGMEPKEASLSALREFYIPLTSGTLTTIAVFVPLFFISGITGEFIASIPFTMIFVLLASIFVALGLLPVIASSFLKNGDGNGTKKLQDKQEYYTHKIQVWYEKVLRNIIGDRKIEKRITRAAVLLLIIALMLPSIGLVKIIFFPQENVDFVFIEIEKPHGTTLEQTDLSVRQVEEFLYNEPDVESFVTTVGASSDFGTSPGSDSKFGNITINLNKNRKRTSTEVSSGLREAIAEINDAEIRILESNSGPPVGDPVVVTISGDDLIEMESVALLVENALEKVSGSRDVTSSTKDDGIQFVLTVDKAKATELGLSPTFIAQTLRTAVVGSEATTITSLSSEDIDVVVKLDLNPNFKDPHETNVINVDAVKNIQIQTPRGPVFLGSIIDVEIEKGNAAIQHKENKRIVTVSSQLLPGNTAGSVLGDLKDSLSDFDVPEGIELSFGGENEDVDQSFKDMFAALIGGLFLMLLILVLQFNSYRYTFFILIIVPFSLIGILGGLALTGRALSFPSIMGFIALAGILVNNAIILIDKMNSVRKASPEKSIIDVVVESSVSRLRPILLTTLTTVIGIVPLTYASELWAPLAYSIIFGLSFSVLLTLVLVPIMYHRWPGKNK